MEIKAGKNTTFGFTVIDLLVSIGIITAIFGVVLFNFRSSTDDQLYKDSRNIFINDLRRTHTWGVAGQQYQGSYPDQGYGIKFIACDGGVCAYESTYFIISRGETEDDVSSGTLLGLTTIDGIELATSDNPAVWVTQSNDIVVEYNLDSVAVYVDDIILEDVVAVRIDTSYPGISEQYGFEINVATGLIRMYEI